jgi:pyridoxine 5-phosphate synthase
MTAKLSVNINKVALIRNGRGGDLPNLIEFASYCEKCGAQGITVHPRPDERHIRFSDLPLLKEVVKTELNVEGYPSPFFLDKVRHLKPHQVTLVPDAPDALTSNSGWEVDKHFEFLKKTVDSLQKEGIRTSLFLNAEAEQVAWAKKTGTDRIELYTGDFASLYPLNPQEAIRKHAEAAKVAKALDLGLNAGHDLSLTNLKYYADQIPGLLEVSIGHALISDALYYGISSTIEKYLDCLKKNS